MSDHNDDTLRSRLRGLRVFSEDLPTFDPASAPDQPAELFVEWLTAAIEAGVPGPHAMTLSTVDAEGRPNARVLILKDVQDGRWQFATTRTSTKGRELDATPAAALTFHWPQLARQVRLRGRVLDAGPEAAARDFLARPDGSRAESLVGRQSQVLREEADLDGALEEARSRVSADPELVPEAWVVYDLVPDEIEFWQGEAHRRHVRLRYVLREHRWVRERLWP